MSTESELMTEALTIPEQAKSIQVTDKSSYELAGALLKSCKDLRKKIEETFKPMKQSIDASKKEVIAQEKKALKPLDEAEKIILPAMVQYDEKYGAPAIEGVRKPVECWKFTIIDEKLITREWLTPDEKKIGEWVRTMKGETKIPGVEVFCERGGVRVDKKEVEF